MLHPLIKNMLQTVNNFEISCFRAPFSWLENPEIAWGKIWQCSDGVPPIHFFQAKHRIQFRSSPMQFLGFSNHEKGALRQEVSK
jgi:hypothetical protein